MPTSSGELDRFLADLSVRRQRLLTLVEDEDSAAGLVEEVLELSEQLLVADEELRVQQEELESVREQMEALGAEWSAMFQSSSAALVLTDQHGVVLQATRPAAQLVLQPVTRRAPRPIATWFDVPDRSRIRGLISRRDLGDPLALQAATLRRSDGSTLLVDVRVTPTPNSGQGQMVLSWELTPTVAPALRLVDGEPPSPLAQELATVATRLAQVRSLPEVLATVVDEAVRVVPGAERAVVVSRRKNRSEILAAAGPEGADGEEGVGVPLVVSGHPTAELRLYAAPPARLSGEATQIADLLGAHVRIAVERAGLEDQLHHAAESHQRIGQAVGVLVERRRITPEQAFAALVERSQHTNTKLREVARILLETGLDLDQIPAS